MRPQPTRLVLNNHITLVVTPNPTANIIAARFLLRAGGFLESPTQMGLVNLLASVLTKGTQHHSSLEIAEIVEYCGGSLGTDSGDDFFVLSLKSISEDFPKLLHLAAELLRQPSFPASEVELEKQMILQGIRSKQEYPFTLGFDCLRSHLYGEHPYGYPSSGTLDTVSHLQPSDLAQFHQAYFRPDNLVVSIAGRIDPDTAFTLVQEAFGDWPCPPTALQIPQLTLNPAPSDTLEVPKETHQSLIILGYLGVAVTDPEYITLKLINSYLGNGMSSRLFTELREKQGLAYEVSALFPSRLYPALFAAYIGTAPQNQSIAHTGLRHEVDRLGEILIPPEELEAAKSKILGQYALGKQTNAQIAQLFGWYESLGVGLDFDQQFPQQLQAITAQEIQAVAQRYLQNPCTTVVGKVPSTTSIP